LPKAKKPKGKEEGICDKQPQQEVSKKTKKLKQVILTKTATRSCVVEKVKL
jgi:hypothetical protein